MTKKDDAEAVGNAVLKTMSAVARESGGEKLTGHAKVLNDLLDEVVGLQQTVNVRIYRQGYGLNAGKEEYITSMTNTDPQSLRDGGLEPMIQGVCGGGDYRLSITAPGIQAKSIRLLIAGESLPMKAERDMKAGTLPPWGMPTMMPDGKLGYNMAMPGVAQYLGLAPQGSQQQPQGQQSNLGEALMLAQIITQQRQGNSSGDDEEKKKLMEMISELKAQNARAEADKARIESERRSDAQIAELTAKMEKMAAPREDASTKLLAMAPLLAPVILAYFKSRDDAAAAAAQAQRDAAQSQMTLMMTMFNSQGSASKESIEMFKTMMMQPKESETDRMRGIMDLAMSSMSTTMGLTQSMVNQMASMQPGERPPWMEVLMTVIENAATMGQMALESRGAKKAEEDEEPQPKQLGRAEVRALQPAPQDDGSSDMLDAASAAAAAAQQHLNDPGTDGVMTADEARMAGLDVQDTMPDFSAGAFKLIFEKISEHDGDGIFTGNVYEVAFRLWKHASSGDKQALIWVQNPEEYTIAVLDGLAQRGLILVTAERIHEIASAMVDMHRHFTRGGTAQEYVQRHSLTISLPKRVVVTPLEVGMKLVEVEEDEAAVEDAPPADKIVEETLPEPKEPAVATPSFGGAPPAREPV